MKQRKQPLSHDSHERATHETATSVVDRDAVAVALPNGIVTAVVEDISPDGVALVVLTGETRRLEAASVLQFSSAAAASESLLGRTVLVLVRESAQPVILGVAAERLWDTRDDAATIEAQFALPPAQARAVEVDKRQVHLDASEEIRLTCGKSSLVMRRDGTVVIRGVRIVSRALESNKIRGATVSLN